MEREKEKQGIVLLEELATETGGHHFLVRRASDLSEVAAKIGDALRNQYIIGYRATGDAPPGKWQGIRVKLNLPSKQKRLHVDARRGYYAPER